MIRISVPDDPFLSTWIICCFSAHGIDLILAKSLAGLLMEMSLLDSTAYQAPLVDFPPAIRLNLDVRCE